MIQKTDTPYDALERLFHEPNRLAIMSSLAGSSGLTFGELKEICGLTDGNLSRHLKTLEDAGAVAIKKTFINRRPRTTVYLSDEGKQRFLQYIGALEQVLKQAAEQIQSAEDGEKERIPPFGARLART
jgi:DNA-binding transcriptional ArsR family regulator